jgi:hypothetical protein
VTPLVCPYCEAASLAPDANPRNPARILDDGFQRTFYVCGTCFRHTVKLTPTDRPADERP